MTRTERTRRAAAGRIRRARERRKLAELTEQVARLTDQDRWRAGLVSALGHDMRSPLAAVVSMAELLRAHADALGPARRTDLLLAILRQSQRALVLADDLLDMARLDEGEFVLKPEQTVLEDLVRRSVLGYELDVEVRIPPGLVLTCDPGRIGQVIANLVDNARRHGRPPIEVTASRDAGVVTVVVRDGGPGVPEEVRPRLFTRFGAGDHPDSTGLGLWLSGEIAQAHGGDLSYRDRPDAGAEFVITLPDDPRRHAGTD